MIVMIVMIEISRELLEWVRQSSYAAEDDRAAIERMAMAALATPEALNRTSSGVRPVTMRVTVGSELEMRLRRRSRQLKITAGDLLVRLLVSYRRRPEIWAGGAVSMGG